MTGSEILKHLKASLVGKLAASLVTKYVKETKGGVKGSVVTTLAALAQALR